MSNLPLSIAPYTFVSPKELRSLAYVAHARALDRKANEFDELADTIGGDTVIGSHFRTCASLLTEAGDALMCALNRKNPRHSMAHIVRARALIARAYGH